MLANINESICLRKFFSYGPVFYSVRKLLIGLAIAARNARKPTVSIVMAMASKAAIAKIHQPMLIR